MLFFFLDFCYHDLDDLNKEMIAFCFIKKRSCKYKGSEEVQDYKGDDPFLLVYFPLLKTFLAFLTKQASKDMLFFSSPIYTHTHIHIHIYKHTETQ